MVATDDKGPILVGVSIAMIILSTICISLRLYSRWVSKKAGIWWDDWFAVASVPFIWISCALGIYWVHLGLGKHIAQAPGKHSTISLILFVENFIYNTGLSLVKLSVLFFYARVFRRVPAYRAALYVTGALLVGWMVAINFLALFTCIPVRKAWNPTLPGHCLTTRKTFLGATISNIVLDFILLVLPLPMLWALRIETSRKFALVGVFVAGYCVIILSILRLKTILDLGDKLQKDFTWNLADPQILVTLEVPVALLSACLPSIFQLVKLTLYARFQTMFSSRGTHALSGPGGSHLDPMGNPINSQKRHSNGFSKLGVAVSATSDVSQNSAERLFEEQVGGQHYTTAHPAKGMAVSDVEQGFPMRQIHVREDVRIDDQRR